MNTRQALMMIVVIAMVLLLGMMQLMKIFNAAPVLIFLVLPFIAMIALSSKCPGCNQPIHGALDFYDSLVSGKCNACNKTKS